MFLPCPPFFAQSFCSFSPLSLLSHLFYSFIALATFKIYSLSLLHLCLSIIFILSVSYLLSLCFLYQSVFSTLLFCLFHFSKCSSHLCLNFSIVCFLHFFSPPFICYFPSWFLSLFFSFVFFISWSLLPHFLFLPSFLNVPLTHVLILAFFAFHIFFSLFICYFPSWFLFIMHSCRCL